MGHTSRSSVPTVPPIGGVRRRVRGVIGGIRRKYVRSLIKYSAPVVVAALALSACGTKGGDTASGGSTGGEKKCDLQIGFFGALDRRRRQPRHQHQERRQPRPRRSTTRSTRTARSPSSSSTPRAAETQAPALAKTAIDDKTVIGIVGPAFSGESKAADPAFNEAGLATITPVGDQPGARQATAGRPSSASSATTRPRAPRPRSTSRTPQGHQGVRHRRRVGVRQGPGRHRQVRPRLRWSSAPTRVQQKQTDFSATVTKVKASGADALFYGGYYAEAGLLVKQLRDAGWKGTVRRRRRRQGRRLHQGRRRRPPRARS